MIKVTNLQEMNHIENAALQMHIRKKAETNDAGIPSRKFG